jgi:hypothetical protein
MGLSTTHLIIFLVIMKDGSDKTAEAAAAAAATATQQVGSAPAPATAAKDTIDVEAKTKS